MSKQKSPARQSPQPNHPQQHTIVSAQQWTGPLPPPAALEQFNQIIPNGAERIMQMVEQEQAHRISHETNGLAAAIRDTRRGHWLGGLISLAAIAASVYTAHIGAHPTVSIALVGVPIATIINAILKNKSK